MSGTPLYRTEKVLGKDGVKTGFRNVLEFDELNVANPKVKEAVNFLKKNGASKENISNILAGFNRIKYLLINHLHLLWVINLPNNRLKKL